MCVCVCVCVCVCSYRVMYSDYSFKVAYATSNYAIQCEVDIEVIAVVPTVRLAAYVLAMIFYGIRSGGLEEQPL